MGKTIGSNFNIAPPDISIGSNSNRHKTKTIKHLSFATLAATCASLAAFSTGITSTVYADTATSSQHRVGARLQTNSVAIRTTGDVNIDIVPSSTGTLGIGKSTVTVETSATSGYQLYISAPNAEPNSNTALYYDGIINSGSKLTGISSDTPTNFTTANQWGYATDAGGFSGSTAYENIINAGSTTDRSTINGLTWKGMDKNLSLIKTATGSDNTTNVYYGIYVDNTLMTGNYQNSVIYTAFVDGANKLEIYPTTIKNGELMTITAEYRSETLPITDTNRISVALLDGETSVGTCNNLNILENASNGLLKLSCTVQTNSNFRTGRLYDVALDLTIEGREGKLSYRADDAWGNVISNGIAMQDVTPAMCAAAEEHAIFGLVDSRTNASYLVTKMKDGNCWMTQNLYFPENTTTITTQNGNSYTLPTSEPNGFSNTGHKGNGWYDGGVNGHKNNAADANDNTGSRFGWTVATAGTGNLWGETDLTSPTTAGGAIASDSVCPQGWKLPAGGSDGDFDKLYATAYSSNYSDFKTYWSGSLDGYCYDSNCADDRGSLAYWWSATQGSGNSSYYMSMNNSSFGTVGHSYKFYGFSVRCMIDTAGTMQGFTQDAADNLTNGETITLKDNRDGKSYLVAKMADNNVWMVQNLAIEPGTNLMPNNSDTNAIYTIPSTTAFTDDTAQDAIVPSHIDATPDDKDNNTGGYYSWLTATANSGASLTTAGQEAAYSICPKDWKLPLRDNGLLALYGSCTGDNKNADFQAVWRGALVGNYGYGSLSNNGDYDYWWSREANDSVNARGVYQDGAGVLHAHNNYNRYGFSVRCIFDPQN